MCTCLADVDEQLKEHNTRLATSFVMTRDRSGMDVLPLLQIEKIDTHKRGQPMSVLPTFCPFCGEKYPRAGEEGKVAPMPTGESQ